MDARIKVLCQICGTNVPYGRMAKHLDECKASKPFPCGICPRFFSTQSGVSRHQAHLHSAEERGTIYSCHYTDCDFGTNNKGSLQTHLALHITGFRRSRSRSRSRSRQPEPQYQQQHQEEEVTENPGPQSSSRQHNFSDNEPQPAQHDHQLYQEEIVASTRSLHNINLERQSNQHNLQPPQEETNYRSRSRQPIDPNIQLSFENSQEPEVQNVTDCEVDQDETDKNVSNNQQDEIEPVPGVYNLRLVDPVKARMIMARENKALDDIVKNLRDNNNQLRKFCIDRNMQLGSDIIGEMIEEYMRTFSVSDPIDD